MLFYATDGCGRIERAMNKGLLLGGRRKNTKHTVSVTNRTGYVRRKEKGNVDVQ